MKAILVGILCNTATPGLFGVERAEIFSTLPVYLVPILRE